MKKLPLYEERPALALEARDVPGLSRNPTCSRCPLGAKARNVCLPPRFVDGDPDVGTLLVVLDGVTAEEDRIGSIGRGEAGLFVQRLVGKHWKGRVIFETATKCPGGKDGASEKAVEACRPYLMDTFRSAPISRIITVGGNAALAVFGRTVSAFQNRKGYSFVEGYNEHPDDDEAEAYSIPVFPLFHALQATRNTFVRKWFEEDLVWALRASPPPPPLDGTAYVVETADDAREALAVVRAAPVASFDVETAGRMFTTSWRLLSLAIAPDANGVKDAYVWTEEALADPAVNKGLIEWLEDEREKKTGSNGKYDALSSHATWGARVRGLVRDVRLQRKLLDPEADGKLDKMVEMVGMGGMKEVAGRLLKPLYKEVSDGYSRRTRAKTGSKKNPPHDLDLAARFVEDYGVTRAFAEYMADKDNEKESWGYALLPKDILHRYNARDAVGTMRLDKVLAPALAASPALTGVWDSVIRGASQAVVQVEAWGIAIDREAATTLQRYLDAREGELREKLSGHAAINWGSRDQVAEFFFKKCGLPSVKKTDTGADSTDADALEALSKLHPAAALLMDLRSVDKLNGTYARGLLPHIRGDGRIHPSLLLDGARCLPRGELVLTARGYLPVEAVAVGDTVLTHEGRGRPVTAVIENPPAIVYRVTLVNGLSLRTTGAHEYLVAGTWVRADALCTGDVATVHAAPEEWRVYEGWPYLVSSWGRVRHANGGAPLAQQRKYPGTRQGHLKVCLVRGDRSRASGNRKDFAVHGLVCATFHGSRPFDGAEVRHINGISWDNTAENLAWGTAKENRADAVSHGADFARASRVLTADDAAEMRAAPRKPHGGAGRWATTGVSDASLAERFGISREQVRDIRSGKRWLDPRSPEARARDRRATFFASEVVAVVRESAETNIGLVVDGDHSHVTAGVVTHNSGRTSCQNPNLQNQPRPDSVEAKMVRDLFIAERGKKLVQLDYSQLELRVACMLSRDEEMLKIFLEGVDYHQRTAELISRVAWGIEPEQVEKKHRSFAKCFHPSTEVLTRSGWKPIPSLLADEEVIQAVPGLDGACRFEWVIPTEVFTKHHDAGRLVHLKNEGIDLRVTPDHRMLGWRVSGKHYVTLPESMDRARLWANAGALSGGSDVSEALVRLAMATQADGSVDVSGAIRFGFTKARKVERLKVLLAGIPYGLKVAKNGVTSFRLSRAEATPILSLLDRKRLSWEMLGWSEAARATAVEEARHWDSTGWGTDTYRFDTALEQNADVLQALAASVGRKTRKVTKADGGWSLTVRSRGTTQGGSLSIKSETFTDEVACLSVPSTFVLVRDGGIPVVTGQTINFGLLYGKGDKTIAEEFGCTVDEAAKIRAAILGKFRKLAAWCREREQEARLTGEVWTTWNGKPARRRPLYRIGDADDFTRSVALHGAVNSPIQGTANEYGVASLAATTEWILDDVVPAKLVLFVHDSLMFEVDDAAVDEVIYNGKRIMTQWETYGVPLVADVEIGDAWGSLVKVKE